jgi:hypothetical protein
MNIDIERHYADDFGTTASPKQSLARKRWHFMVMDNHSAGLVVQLRGYYEETRPSTRHRNWEPIRLWPKNRDYSLSSAILPAPESIPDDVLAEVKQKIVESLRFEIGARR